MSTLHHRLAAARLSRKRVSLAVAFLRVTLTLAEWRRRARSRAALAQLSSRDLRDIGLSPEEQLQECRKAFWRA
jgi:uncharacterized protein YjiS (DUF1127 family)